MINIFLKNIIYIKGSIFEATFFTHNKSDKALEPENLKLKHKIQVFLINLKEQ